MRVFARGLPFIIKKFHFVLCMKWRSGAVTFRVSPAPTCQHLMALNRIHTHLGRLLAVWITATGLVAAEHHGTVKSGGLSVPGATVTASKGDKKLFTTTDENGRYSFADLADGAWTIEGEMLGFGKLSNGDVAPLAARAGKGNVNFLSRSATRGPAAAPAAPATPAPAATATAT